MILNLLRVKELTVQDMMKRSFAEYYFQKDAPENEKKLDELQKRTKVLKDPDCPLCSIDLKDYYLTWAEVFQLNKEIKVIICRVSEIHLVFYQFTGFFVLKSISYMSRLPIYLVK